MSPLITHLHSYDDNSAISIALCVNKRAMVGVIYNPMRRELFWAIKGSGAFVSMDGGGEAAKLQTSSITDLHQSLVCVEYGPTLGEPDKIRDMLERQIKPLLQHPVHGLRSAGAATMNLMAVARGSAEVYIEAGLKAWDMAAGELIVREAGGIITAITSTRDFMLTGEEIIASCNATISVAMRQIVSE